MAKTDLRKEIGTLINFTSDFDESLTNYLNEETDAEQKKMMLDSLQSMLIVQNLQVAKIMERINLIS